MPRSLHEIAVAAAVASVVSGAPSTAHAVFTGRPPLEAARAAATLLPRHRDHPNVAQGLFVHVVVSAGWGAVLGLVLPKRHTVGWGAVAGLAIAALDLDVVARRKAPAIAALPQAWQWADHAVFGATVGWVLSRSSDLGDR
jgi:hypothetical protein